MRHTPPPSHTLSFDDAVKIWLRYLNGEIQSRLAASFDVNQGRISEVLKEKRHIGSKAVALRLRKASA